MIQDHKFKPGDRVKTKSNNKGIVKTASGHYSDGTPIYYVQFDQEWMNSDVVRENELDSDTPDTPYVYIPTPAPKCECGAWSTSFENSHSTWCVKYVRP